MIGMAGENSAGAVELLQQHDANEVVRPSRRAEGKHAGSASVQGLGEPVGAANDKTRRRMVLRPPLAQHIGEACAVEVVASFIENGDDRLFGNDVCDRNRFLAPAPLRIARATFADFNDLNFAKPEGPSDCRRAFTIGGGELAFCALFQPANGGNHYTQSNAP